LRDSLDKISSSRTSDCSDAASSTRAEDTQANAAAAASTARAGTEAEDVLGAEASTFRVVGDDTLGLIEHSLLQISLENAGIREWISRQRKIGKGATDPKTLQIRGPLRKLDPVGI
jgi:hypothetical protein